MAVEDTKMSGNGNNHGYANDAVKRVSRLAENLAPAGTQEQPIEAKDAHLLADDGKHPELTCSERFVNEMEERGINFNVTEVVRNATPSVLYEYALQNEKGSYITNTGALSVTSGKKTGR